MRPARSRSARTRSARSSPDIPGIMPSIRATGNGSPRLDAARRAARASGPPSTETGRAPQLVKTSSRMRRLVALSSTISTGMPSRPGRLRHCRRRPSSAGCCSSRAVKWKVLPWPGSLSTQIRPPISSTSCDEIVRPRPVPPYCRVVEPSACSNGSKIGPLLLGGMPMPVSRDGEVQADLVRRSRPFTLDVDHDLAALGELDRVADQVDEDLPQPARVADEGVGHVGGDLAGQLQPLRVRRGRPACSSSSLEGVAQVEGDAGPGRACRPRSWRSRGCR